LFLLLPAQGLALAGPLCGSRAPTVSILHSLCPSEQRGFVGMDNIWLASALWIGLALIASAMQAWVAVSVALLEIIIGAVAGTW